jgi:serine/threonine protein kinase
MKSDRWQQIERLFYAAREMDSSRRTSFLSKACAGDETLRREVSALLDSDAQAGDFLVRSAIDVAADAIALERAQRVAGQWIGSYSILSFLGAGGMGEVYLARDTRLGRKVALKLLPAEFTQDRDRVRRFEQEACAASALNHPNILTIYEVGSAEGVYFLASEYVDGQTLRERLLSTPLTTSEVLDVALQVASALSAAHAAGIVHRDIKPENVMLRRDGYVKVLDFGLAKLITPFVIGVTTVAESEATQEGRLETDPGRLMGTARYMSPEQVEGKEIDGRSDIFSLGVVLYELLTGRAPFEGATPGAVMAAILHHEPTPAASSGEGSVELGRIIDKALAKAPESRYQAVSDLLNELKALKEELDFKARLKRTAQPDAQVQSSFSTQVSTSPLGVSPALEPIGGAVPLDSRFYIVRPTDAEFQRAIERQDSIVLVKGARQVGKTSLLARGLQKARASGARVVLTDFQSLSEDCLQSAETLFFRLAATIVDQLDLGVLPEQVWSAQFGPSINFERYLRREVLAKVSSPIVWGLDEVDRLFTCGFGSEVFGLFRSWHNKRALDPDGPWRRLTLAIAYATEAHLFITNLNQSPFNVGTQLVLEDFTRENVAELNRRYGSPLRGEDELTRYYQLVGGHPYLVRRGLHELAVHHERLAALEARASQDDGPFGNHLRRLLVSLSQDRNLCEAVKGLLQGKSSLSTDSYYRLHSAGLIAGEAAQQAIPRCELYAAYLREHLS